MLHLSACDGCFIYLPASSKRGGREGEVDLESLHMSVVNVELARGGWRTVTICPPFIFAGE